MSSIDIGGLAGLLGGGGPLPDTLQASTPGAVTSDHTGALMAKATPQASAPPQPAFTPLSVHVSTAAEANAYLVEKLTNEGVVVVSDPATGQKRQLRLAVVMVAGTPALIAVADV